jgi:hypothetical protein
MLPVQVSGQRVVQKQGVFVKIVLGLLLWQAWALAELELRSLKNLGKTVD